MARWTVLGRRKAGDDWDPVGEVHAPDAEMALLLAKESFFRHGEGVDLAVTRGEEFRALDAPDLLQFWTDKSYKLQKGYPLGEKRRRAAARITPIDRPRPVDKRRG